MTWLIRSLMPDAPPSSTVESWGFGFRGPFTDPVWLVLWAVAAVLVLALIVVLYSRERARMGLGRRLTLMALRVGSVGLLMLLLLRPVLFAEFKGEKPRPVVFLLDNSQSMTLRDQRLSPQDRLRVAIAEDRVAPDVDLKNATSLVNIPTDTSINPSRADLVRAILSNDRLKLLEKVPKRGPFAAYVFGRRLSTVAEASGDEDTAKDLRDRLLKAFTIDESRTALADCLLEAVVREEGDVPSAIVLVTDGRDNASKLTVLEAARECARHNVALHIYGVGSSDIGNLQLKDVLVPETIFYDDAVSVPVRFRSQGFKQGTATITLTLGGQVVATRQVPVKEGDDLREVLTFTPKKGALKEEKLDLVATIKFSGSEVFTEDNEQKRPVRLIDHKIRVLYIENSPRWEFKFLQAMLLRDRRVEPKFILVNADPRTLKEAGSPFLPAFPSTRQELFAFDLVILGDVPAGFLGTEHMNWLRDFVSEGAGLVQIAGRQHGPASYVGTPLEEVLPVDFLPVKFPVEADARPQMFHPVLTRQGERAEMLALADTPEESLKVWKGLPGFYWHYPVTKLRPGAVSLLAHPTQKVADQLMPLLALHYYGRGMVLFCAGDETWRWRYNAQDRYFARFWGQVIYQLGLLHSLGGPKRVQFAMDRADITLGKQGYVYVRLFDQEYRPLVRERIPARLEQLDAKPGQERTQTITLEPVPDQPGEYRALLSHDTVGQFALKLEQPEAATLDWRVTLPPHHELEVAGMAEDLLREAASISGGRFYREENLHELAGAIEVRAAPYIQRRESLLWNWRIFLVFVGLVTAEWVVRKFSNLS